MRVACSSSETCERSWWKIASCDRSCRPERPLLTLLQSTSQPIGRVPYVKVPTVPARVLKGTKEDRVCSPLPEPIPPTVAARSAAACVLCCRHSCLLTAACGSAWAHLCAHFIVRPRHCRDRCRKSRCVRAVPEPPRSDRCCARVLRVPDSESTHPGTARRFCPVAAAAVCARPTQCRFGCHSRVQRTAVPFAPPEQRRAAELIRYKRRQAVALCASPFVTEASSAIGFARIRSECGCAPAAAIGGQRSAVQST